MKSRLGTPEDAESPSKRETFSKYQIEESLVLSARIFFEGFDILVGGVDEGFCSASERLGIGGSGDGILKCLRVRGLRGTRYWPRLFGM